MSPLACPDARLASKEARGQAYISYCTSWRRRNGDIIERVNIGMECDKTFQSAIPGFRLLAYLPFSVY